LGLDKLFQAVRYLKGAFDSNGDPSLTCTTFDEVYASKSRMRKKFYVLIFAFTLLSITAAGQVSSDEEKVALPDPVMEHVVSRILRWQFKPADRPKSVPISEQGIKREWLPTIQNISFRLASDNDALKAKNGVFLFEGLQRVGRHYSIKVGWGDFECRGSGDIWEFRVGKGDNVRLWRAGDQGWGRGCSGNGPPTIRGLRIGETSPNELPEFKFFAKGKLAGLKLGSSTKEDVRKILGDSCEGQCDYDENWSIWAGYFDADAVITETTTDDKGAEVKYEYFPKPEYAGTLQVIRLAPKKRMFFGKQRFPAVFGQNESYSVGDAWDENGFGGAVHTTLKTYTDGYGLKYSVFDEETFNNLKVRPKKAEPDTRPGDLIQIEYAIPRTLRDILYTRRLKTSK
jgi:hypothetical protein